MAKRIGLLMALGLLPLLGYSQAAPDALEACYQQPDGAPRLACFDKEMQRRHASAAAGAPAPTKPPLAAVAPAAPATAAAPAAANTPADDTVGLQGSALRRKLQQENVAPPVVQPIVATVVRMLPRPDNSEVVFVLDNGQSWEQAEAMQNLNVKLHDTVTIKPGVLGAFFLNTPRRQRVRVRRIL